MTKTAKDGFTQFLRWLTPSDAERAKASSHRAAIEAKLDARFGIFKMFESGSFRHGTGVSGKSDVDFFVSLKTSRPTYSSSTLSAVKDALQDRFPTTYIHQSRPGIVLEFGGGYERVEVIPAYYQDSENGSSRYKIPGVVDEWLDSTPEAHNSYVNSCNTAPVAGGAKGLARLAKAWKYYRDVPISSFYLEMRAAHYMSDESSISYPQDIYRYLRDLQNIDLASMNDPTGNTGRIRPCSSDANLSTAKSRLATAVMRASNANDAYLAGNIESAFEWWDKLFNGEFPSYY